MDTIETERLSLRPYTKDDVPLMHGLMSDSRVMAHHPFVFDWERSVKGIDNVLAMYDRFGYSLLAVELRGGGFIGHVGLLHWDDVDAREDVEVAYYLLPQYWGKGYASEAARACRDWAFEHLPVDRVVSFIVTENAPSIAVAERNGMSRLKRLEENRFGRPIYVYGITREQWSARSNEFDPSPASR
jgi:[ribosomal protein S5]-alanine N-acetyltransferase